MRKRLVAAIGELRQEKAMAPGALAGVLGCSERTIERLAGS